MKKKQILIVEDERIVADDIKMSLEKLGYAVPAVVCSGEEAVKKTEEIHPDLVLMDIVLGEKMDGIEAAEIIRSRFNIPVVYLTAYSDKNILARAKVTSPFGYIIKPFEDKDVYTAIEIALYQHEIENKLKEKEERLRKNLEEAINALMLAVEMKDPFTAGHQQGVTELACAIAEEMSLEKELIEGLRLAALIHDIGKIQIPAEILIKPHLLSETEFHMIQMHPQIGYDMLKSMEFSYPVAQIILQHHERIDGSGYPSGLSHRKILLEARILAVADVVEAMSSPRPYRPAYEIKTALMNIKKYKGILYDPEVVDACLGLFYEKGFSFEYRIKTCEQK